MEHRWGEWILSKGLGDLHATLGSYVPTIGPHVWILNVPTTGYSAVGAIIPADTHLPITFWSPFKIYPGQHFPYGYAVAADGPV